jgi:hypothetical protein
LAVGIAQRRTPKAAIKKLSEIARGLKGDEGERRREKRREGKEMDV